MLKSSPKKIIRSSPIMTFLLFALTIFLPAKMSALEIVPETESAVVGSQTVFVLELPDSEPSKVEFINPSPMEEASVTGATKTAYAVENGGTGTRIELYIVFFKDGYFQLPNLQLHIDDLNYSVPFRPFQVYKNPSEIQPELFCEFENGVEGDFSAEAGKPIMFTVFARYFLQVASYSYEIPENALFRELEKFPAVSENQGRREFSAEKVPIARFEWTPLVQGTADLPAVHLDVTAYSGAKVALSLSDSQSIRVLPSSSEKKEVAKTESLFAYAFTPTGENSSDSEIAEPVSTEIRVLSRLRDKERRSLPFSNTRAVRREVESAMGLMPGDDEPFIIVPIALWILTAVAAILMVTFFRRKHSVKSFAAFFSFICLIVCASVFTARQRVPYGVFTGGGVYPIPEKSAKTSFYIHGGNRVRIMERTPGWLYIAFNNIEGWVPANMVEPIKSAVFEIEK